MISVFAQNNMGHFVLNLADKCCQNIFDRSSTELYRQVVKDIECIIEKDAKYAYRFYNRKINETSKIYTINRHQFHVNFSDVSIGPPGKLYSKN